MQQLKCIFTLILVIYLLCTANVFAGTYKCIDDNGGVTYSQAPCPSTQKTEKEIKVTTNSKGVDCKYANKFSRVVAISMKGGADSDDAFNQYGGMNSLSKGSINIINYVYSHRLNTDIAVGKIASLVRAKCKAQSFGDVSCEEIPLSITSQLGGCGYEYVDQISEQYLQDRHLAKLEAEKLKKKYEEDKKLREKKFMEIDEKYKNKCQGIYQEEIDKLNEKMRNGYSISEGNRYPEKLENLENKKKQC